MVPDQFDTREQETRTPFDQMSELPDLHDTQDAQIQTDKEKVSTGMQTDAIYANHEAQTFITKDRKDAEINTSELEGLVFDDIVETNADIAEVNHELEFIRYDSAVIEI